MKNLISRNCHSKVRKQKTISFEHFIASFFAIFFYNFLTQFFWQILFDNEVDYCSRCESECVRIQIGHFVEFLFFFCFSYFLAFFWIILKKENRVEEVLPTSTFTFQFESQNVVKPQVEKLLLHFMISKKLSNRNLFKKI